MSRKSLVRLSAIAIPILFALYAIWITLMPRSGESWRLVLNIPNGASAGRIGRILAEHKVIRSAAGFDLLARITGKSSRLKSGAYKLSPSMPPGAIMDKMVKGEICAKWITIPEGFTIWQIADRLAAQGLVNEDRFLHAATGMEGYLFPDTYLIPLGSTEASVIGQMRSDFNKKAGGYISSGHPNMPLNKIIILASLIEREAKVPRDRPLVSAVLRNRLNKGMRLQVDATVLYALGHHKTRVMYSDLNVDSPYNTYRYAGLPPGPIANPGLDCIKAAMNPADVDFLYYVARPDGSHIFSRTLAEHQHNIKLVRMEAHQN